MTKHKWAYFNSQKRYAIYVTGIRFDIKKELKKGYCLYRQGNYIGSFRYVGMAKNAVAFLIECGIK